MTRSALGSLPAVGAKVHAMGLRWCQASDGCYFRRTRGLSARPDYSQVFDSAWSANRAVVEGTLTWSDVEPGLHPEQNDENA